jgi:FtsP/CotA-like multicopper oxidase with cupredoxin domain
VVTIDDAYLPQCSATITTGCYTAAAVAFTFTSGGPITSLTGSGGAGYVAPVVTITDPTGTGALADAVIGGTLTGGIPKFVDKLSGLGPANANSLGQFIPVAVPGTAPAPTPASPASDYYEIALVEYNEQMHSNLPPTRLRGYVQIVPQGWSGSDILGNTYNAVALTTANGLAQNIMIGGAQAYGASKPHYLGPVIAAKGRVHGIAGAAGEPKPVRIKFYNLLPPGAGGNLFLPVDETVAGAGIGPALPGTAGSMYTQNRAAVHLHGNNTVWISDGNVHQWITPPNENTPYPRGVTVKNVPDMGTACDAPGSGCMTLFYTNAQSARLQFYHDHSMGITRLNVYAGEAGGYVITDAVEQDIINGTNITGVNCFDPPTCSISKKVLPDIGIPLIIQDRTFVDAETIYAQDPTWNWGTSPGTGVTGDLWYPHVYMTVQNPWDLTGTNAFGRWHYGPWFNPPTPVCVNGLPVGCIEVGVVPNDYYQPVCDGLPDPVNPVCTAPWEPPLRPGLPNPSIPGESFLDTQLVNGTAYPYLEVEPKAYRFRVLNASNDRMVNLQLYVAADKTTPTTPGTTGTLLCDPTSATPSPGPVENCTEVKMVPVSVAPANQYADTPSGIPDPGTKGPDWIMIGTEGGFMPKPVVVPQQPIGYNLDPAFFNFGVVNQHSLFLGSAERADVIVDFTGLAGKTLILYNDSPAPVPAGAAPYDYYTGNANQMDAGGAPTTQPGYGPNTRTIMQIRVGTTVTSPTTDVTLANLQAVFAKTASKRGVFEVSQDPIIIPQAAYNSAYNNSFPANASQYIQIADTQKTFQPINEAGVLQPAVTLPLEPKGMHDEMGGVYDTLFGRMSGMLGLTPRALPAPNPARPFILTPYGLGSPPTDIVKGSLEGTPIGVMPDGTQIWRIFHNGVDTHPIHVHLFTAQLINRVGQDGQWYNTDRVDPTELGWKETIKVNPLEITYLALRPTVPTPAQLPFEVPDSVRLIDPTLPEGATLIPPPPAGWFDPDGVGITEILNHTVNFGWEYVWHCHILSHEEMDMMHSLVFAVPPLAPTGLIAAWNGSTGGNRRVTLNWIDKSIKETGFTIQRATNSAFTIGLTTFNAPAAAGSGTTVTYTDTTVANNTSYWYRVWAIGPTVGDTQAYPGSLGFPTMAADSVSNTAPVVVGTTPTLGPAVPTNLAATVQAGPQVRLTWTDNANNETGFVVERCTGAGCTSFAQIATTGPRTSGPATVTYVDTTVTAGNSYLYRVAAVNAASVPPYTYATLATAVDVPAIPVAPTGFTVAVVKANGNNYTATLNWVDNSTNETNFTIQRATNLTFTTGLATFTAAANATTLTQTVNRNTTYYYRIRANNNISGSSAWTNALPFPIRTGN